jgi:hypothetical protein
LARKDLQNVDEYTYGEVSAESLLEVFLWLKNTQSNVGSNLFVDLGHGTGKGVLAGALMNHFDRVSGIEILDDLYD